MIPPTMHRRARPNDPSKAVEAARDLEVHREETWEFLRMLGAPPDLADDLTQEVFLRLVRFRATGEPIRSVQAWLRTAARNAFIDTGRKARGGLPIDSVDVEEAFDERQLHRSDESYTDTLRWAMQRLTPRQRTALKIRYQPGGSRALVAAELNLSDEGVKTLLRRARAELMERMQARMRDADT